MSALRVAITGTTGFLGAHVYDACAAQGFDAVGLVRSPSESSGRNELRADLLDERSLDAAIDQARPDALVHCAAYGVDARQTDLGLAIATNLTGTFALYRAAARIGVRAIVHIGTGYEYGPVTELEPIGESTPLRPIGVYGSTRASASTLLSGVHASLAPSVYVLRPFGMAGPGEGDHKLIPQLVRACVSGTPFPMTAGTEMRDYVAARGVARGIALAVEHAARAPAGLNVMNMCSGTPVSIAALVGAVAEHLGHPELPVVGALPSRPSALPWAVGDPTAWRTWCQAHGVVDPVAGMSILDEVDVMAAQYRAARARS